MATCNIVTCNVAWRHRIERTMQTIVITSPSELKDEAIICNSLFAYGLEILHLRKIGADQTVYEKFIREIEPRYHSRIVVHDHYQLTVQYQLHGIHLKSDRANEFSHYPNQTISISCHSPEEISHLPFRPAYCFLSPVFDSISKPGYSGRFSELTDLSAITVPVIALGGITPEKTDLCRQAGFKGIAALGYIWEKPEEALSRFIRLNTPFVMSIAGFDPSSGAGVTADIKTFESTGSYGLGICTALTFQNEDIYENTRWVSPEEIRQQCELQFQKHRPEYVKIGLIRDFEVLDQLTGFLSTIGKDVKIIWDPIMKASAGPVFHNHNGLKNSQIFDRLYLITPNTDELRQLFGEHTGPEELQQICRKHDMNLLWKGGHNAGADSSDCLITPQQIHSFSVSRSSYGKHGTGCVLSAAITSALARGNTLADACNKAQIYVSNLMDSNNSNLGFHLLSKASFHNKPHPSALNLQYITAPKEGLTLCEQVENVCRGGVRWVQLRMKEASVAQLLEEGKNIKEICRRYNALFIINDNIQVARQLDADGVHLGKEDMDPQEARTILGKDKIIGATCNTGEDILLRQKQQVDYIGLGPFTFTTTKEKLSPVLGLEGYRQLLGRMKENGIHIPVFAIGGITETDIPPLMETGIRGIALSGLIKNSNDLSRKAHEILIILNQKTQL